MTEQDKKVLNETDMMNLLDATYSKVLSGIPMISRPVEEMAQDYLSKNTEPVNAAREMVKIQVVKCTTSGALAGLGGVVTMPVAIPANIGNVLYVQMRMIACAAVMAGYDLKSDQTQTFVYACLAGLALGDLMKKTTIKVGEKVATNMIAKIPGATLTKINQKVGFRLLTKFGEKGVINLGKMLPGVGAIIGGGIDLFSTKAIGDRSIRWFFEGDFTVEEEREKLAEEKKKTVDIIVDSSSKITNNTKKRVTNLSAKTASKTTNILGKAAGATKSFGVNTMKSVKNKKEKSEEE